MMTVAQQITLKLQGMWHHRPFGPFGPVVHYTFTPSHKITGLHVDAYEIHVGPEGALIVASDETVVVVSLTSSEMYWRKGDTTFVLTRS